MKGNAVSKYSRRNFIQTTTTAAAALMAGVTGSTGATRRKIPVGVQLYSVRSIAAGDLPGTLAGIKKIGYEGVEFAGYYKNDAKTLRQMLDDNGLKCCGTHIGLQTMLGDALQPTIEFNRILGNQNLVVPSLPAKNIEAWIKHAETFSEVAEKLKSHKMRIGYHNHTVEFKPLDGQIPEDVFFTHASKDVFVQLDIGHCAHGGADPAVYLKKFPGRVISVHVKEYSPAKRDALVGEGDVKWAEVLQACETIAGTEWYIVEEESGAYKGLEGIERSLQNLKKLLT
jgi:sugar phosphate isomerase/epimerase